VHPISGEGNPQESAKSYQHELKSYFGNSPWPRFDLVLLGMGEDGHTASLFPRTKALSEERAWVAANWVEQRQEFRITLTAPAINSAAQVIFLVTGENKAARLAEVLNGPFQPDLLPAQLIKPDQGELTWIVDATAASQFRV
jgi:6-phosphogluconolactonase